MSPLLLIMIFIPRSIKQLIYSSSVEYQDTTVIIAVLYIYIEKYDVLGCWIYKIIWRYQISGDYFQFIDMSFYQVSRDVISFYWWPPTLESSDGLNFEYFTLRWSKGGVIKVKISYNSDQRPSAHLY